MPNVNEMQKRFSSHLARVSDKAMDREFKRIDRLYADAKISHFTARSMRQTAPIRLAWLAQ